MYGYLCTNLVLIYQVLISNDVHLIIDLVLKQSTKIMFENI